MAHSTITKFLFNDGDYFTALTDMPGVRIGLTGSACFDVPAGHTYYNRIVEANTSKDVEDYFDELQAAFA